MADQQLKFAKRMNKRMLVFSADLDNLKVINDTLGTKRRFGVDRSSNIMKETFRESDIVARIGGMSLSFCSWKIMLTIQRC